MKLFIKKVTMFVLKNQVIVNNLTDPSLFSQIFYRNIGVFVVPL